MPTIKDPELRIDPITPGVGLWRVRISWTLVVPYWELGSWCHEVVELCEGEPRHGGQPLVRWRSRPWQPKADGAAPDGSNFHFARTVPAQLAGPETLDVAPDRDVIELMISDVRPAVLIRLQRERHVDRLHAKVLVVPVVMTPDATMTAVVAGQFGSPL